MGVGDGQAHALARTMSTLARNLEAKPSEDETLSGIVRSAVATVPGVQSGGQPGASSARDRAGAE